MTFQEFKEKFQNKEVEEISYSLPKTPFVSILVQTYQHNSFITDCLDSILKQQTTFDFEILIGEDASEDGTREICLNYAKKYPEKIRLFLHHPENKIFVLGGPTANFNAFYNFFSARGKYIAFCEGDDYWNDNLKLQKQIDFLENKEEYVFAYHSYLTINYNSEILKSSEEEFQPTEDITSFDLSAGTFHPLLLTVCFKKVFDEIPKEMIELINVDTFLFSLLGNYGKAKFLSNIQSSFYRKHHGGLWSHRKKEMKFKSKILTFKCLGEFYKEKDMELYQIFKRKEINTIKMIMYFYFRNYNLIQLSRFSLKYVLKN